MSYRGRGGGRRWHGIAAGDRGVAARPARRRRVRQAARPPMRSTRPCTASPSRSIAACSSRSRALRGPRRPDEGTAARARRERLPLRSRARGAAGRACSSSRRPRASSWPRGLALGGQGGRGGRPLLPRCGRPAGTGMRCASGASGRRRRALEEAARRKSRAASATIPCRARPTAAPRARRGAAWCPSSSSSTAAAATTAARSACAEASAARTGTATCRRRAARGRGDWVIKDGYFAAWVTGHDARGEGWDLTNRRRTRKAIVEVLGVPTTAGGVVRIAATGVGPRLRRRRRSGLRALQPARRRRVRGLAQPDLRLPRARRAAPRGRPHDPAVQQAARPPEPRVADPRALRAGRRRLAAPRVVHQYRDRNRALVVVPDPAPPAAHRRRGRAAGGDHRRRRARARPVAGARDAARPRSRRVSWTACGSGARRERGASPRRRVLAIAALAPHARPRPGRRPGSRSGPPWEWCASTSPWSAPTAASSPTCARTDFEIHEDGARQATASFLRQELPVSLVLLVDASNSVTDRMPVAQAATKHFVAALRPDDEVRVVAFNDRVSVLQELTSDRAALAGRDRRDRAGGATALYNALYSTFRNLPPPDAGGRLRRRVIVLLSDGEDTASLVWEEQVLELVRRREATVHVIALRAESDASNRSARLLRLLSGGERRGSPSPGLDPRPRLRLRADRRRAAQPVHRRLRLRPTRSRTAGGGGSSCASAGGRTCRSVIGRATMRYREASSMTRGRCGLVLALVAVRAGGRRRPLAIDHAPVACVPYDRYTRIAATARPRRGSPPRSSSSGPGRPRLVRHRDGRGAGGREWSAVLPRPMRPLARLEYRIVTRATDADGDGDRGPSRHGSGDDPECGRAAHSSPEVAAPIVVQRAEAAPLVPPVPAGFSPAGVVAAEGARAVLGPEEGRDRGRRRGRGRRRRPRSGTMTPLAGGPHRQSGSSCSPGPLPPRGACCPSAATALSVFIDLSGRRSAPFTISLELRPHRRGPGHRLRLHGRKHARPLGSRHRHPHRTAPAAGRVRGALRRGPGPLRVTVGGQSSLHEVPAPFHFEP